VDAGGRWNGREGYTHRRQVQHTIEGIDGHTKACHFVIQARHPRASADTHLTPSPSWPSQACHGPARRARSGGPLDLVTVFGAPGYGARAWAASRAWDGWSILRLAGGSRVWGRGGDMGLFALPSLGQAGTFDALVEDTRPRRTLVDTRHSLSLENTTPHMPRSSSSSQESPSRSHPTSLNLPQTL